jgi:hypothetical protein
MEIFLIQVYFMPYLADWSISFSFGAKKSALVDGEGFIFCTFHKRGTPSAIYTVLLRTVELFRVLYSPSLVPVPSQTNPLPPLFLKIRLKED